MERLSKVFEMEFVSKIMAKEESSEESYEEVKGEIILKTDVVGNTYIADSGKKRQTIIEELREGEILQLRPEFNHRIFNNLVTVLNKMNEDVGHLPSHIGVKLRPEIESGHKFFAKVQVVKGEKPERVVHIVVYRSD